MPGIVIGRVAKNVSKAEARQYIAGYTIVNDVSARDALAVELTVNSEVKQSSNTSEFIFSVDELIEYLSHRVTLRAGDVISTGTPAGVGIFREPPDLLEPDDTVEAKIDSIGTLRNMVVENTL